MCIDSAMQVLQLCGPPQTPKTMSKSRATQTSFNQLRLQRTMQLQSLIYKHFLVVASNAVPVPLPYL